MFCLILGKNCDDLSYPERSLFYQENYLARLMNIFLFNNRAWFLYTILIDHPAITLKNIYEILQGYATDIRFNDYYSLILARQFADLLTENRTVVELEII